MTDAFDKVLDELREMHHRKNADYGRDEDPYANVRASEDFGIPGWVGALCRGNDKMRRLQKYAKTGSLKIDGPEDDLIDLAVYLVISLILYREQAT